MSEEHAPAGANTAASRWKDLHGERWWDGLLQPLDLDLRRTVLWYGEMAQATYDALNREAASPHAGLCRFARRRFFERVMLPGHAAAYRVTRFLYAPEDRGHRCSWIGYVAVATDEGKVALGRRDIVVAWRGTALPPVADADDDLVVPPRGLVRDSNAMVHRGWLTMYTTSNHEYNSVRDQVLSMVRTLVDTYKEEEVSITVTGHGNGAALATLTAFDIAENSYSTAMRAEAGVVEFPVTAFAFGSPRVGDAGFKQRFQGDASYGLRLLRINNARDVVPTRPAKPSYHHVGPALAIDTAMSPYLKVPATGDEERMWHNLESYLHGVAGVPAGGRSAGFQLAVDRDVALVNKSSDALRDEHGVPARWWVPWNRGMVKGGDGRWRLVDCEEEKEEDDDWDEAIMPDDFFFEKGQYPQPLHQARKLIN